MFLGTYEPRLDAKGRLILPAKFRDQLADGLVMTRGQERCLYVFPAAEFEQMYNELRRAPLSSKASRDYIRVMLSGASNDTPDKQGRIVIPQNLRAYAGLDRELAVIGAGARVEIWNATAWSDYLSAQEEIFSETGDEVVPGLF
ncbi:division/cell wall cluster transcriptional repressor MraZ [Nanchangia anserum]|uniref:Transcriptional regulator MraZ n=1 Tax=Nanchangia anserum TaxID=2692125 RepID=A0A8I0KSC5_9ACTO|nr:division/cell wall cluster transcriptional repressor MraZ [Nanchangia anserum]MBD3690247.1 division/cell wall cluster transcriptional repressor MraZ [Nanchangia anserum]QOX82311.1 division/cell wall cluster transcriptional repressor MraZ [Nanchangia anserum]